MNEHQVPVQLRDYVVTIEADTTICVQVMKIVDDQLTGVLWNDRSITKTVPLSQVIAVLAPGHVRPVERSTSP